MKVQDYALRYPACPLHMIRQDRFAVEQEMIPFVFNGGPLSCPYPGEYVNASVWDVWSWYSAGGWSPQRRLFDNATLGWSKRDPPARWVIRVFDYDDGTVRLYLNDRSAVRDLWNEIINSRESLHRGGRLYPGGRVSNGWLHHMGFRSE